MSAIAGPGPSTLASSSSTSPTAPVPPGVRRMAPKKRIINLVNPADPLEFSSSSPMESPSTSPNSSMEIYEEIDLGEGRRRGSREETPTVYMGEQAPGPVPVFSIRGVDDNGVKGILRQTGTPGSGNGGERPQWKWLTAVRFFPKNRFRVITPNASALSTPQPKAPSLFAQFLSVVPPLSPLRATPRAPADESWEQPGQEGEVSMAASSIASTPADTSMISNPPDEEELGVGEDSWSGVPTQISSPLALPVETSREVSYTDLPSAEMHVPDDMSNLLSTRFSPPPGDSFSILQLPAVPLHPIASSSGSTSPERSWRSSPSTSVNLDDNPTIRRRLSPKTSPTGGQQVPATPHSPTPSADGRPWRSIFADMSAEQAELSWPLSRPTQSDGMEETEAGFHSIALTDTTDLPDLPVPMPCSTAAATATPVPPSSTPRAAGNVTEYFDASSFGWATPCPAPPSRALSLPALAIAPPPAGAPGGLVQPAKALFEAQAEHTSAIIAELSLYRNLAQTLSQEVSERDAALADLNLRAVEAEMLRSQNADLQAELAKRSTPSSDEEEGLRSMKASSRRAHPGDRTTVEQAENRDLEIRLAKALGDQEVMQKQLADLRAARDDVVKQLTESRKAQKVAEERERDRVIGEQKDVDMRAAHEGQIRALQEALHSATAAIEDEKEQSEMRDQAWTNRVEELEQTVVAEQEARKRVEGDLKKAQKSTVDVAALQKEVTKLRLESSSKDLEISALQRRKMELKEDREMLNIALDSKQQELELVRLLCHSISPTDMQLKRKYGVRGVAGSTPLGTSRKVNLDTPAPSAAGEKGVGGTAPRTTRKASGAMFPPFETPLVTDKRTMRHGVPLHASTIKGKNMRGIEEELRAQDAKTSGGSLRRTRMIA